MLSSDALFRGLVCNAAAPMRGRANCKKPATSPPSPSVRPPGGRYSIRKTYGRLLDLVDQAFERAKPLFALPIYYPLAYYIGSDPERRPCGGEPAAPGRRPHPHELP